MSGESNIPVSYVDRSFNSMREKVGDKILTRFAIKVPATILHLRLKIHRVIDRQYIEDRFNVFDVVYDSFMNFDAESLFDFTDNEVTIAMNRKNTVPVVIDLLNKLRGMTLQDFSYSFAIHWDDCYFGNYGSHGKFKLTAWGPAVEMLKMMSAIAIEKKEEIVISEAYQHDFQVEGMEQNLGVVGMVGYRSFQVFGVAQKE